jgi:PAS domain S-box-containing protein
VGKTYQRVRSFVPVADCDRSAHPIRVTASQLCWLVVFLIVPCFRCPSSLGQTPASVNVRVGHDSWTFKDGAPADVTCLAQTNDGLLWLGGPNGLFRFDGTRFEPFSSQFGDRLLSTNLLSLFAPPSGGLWIGYALGGFSFLNKGRVTNYASETGSVHGFAQDRDGIVWAGTTSGLWRFDHSTWQHIGVEWNTPAGFAIQVGFDSKGILWALVGGYDTPSTLIYLTPGTKHFKIAGSNLSVNEFVREPDRTILTAPAASYVSDSGEGSAERLPAYPVISKNFQMVDRNNSVWVSLWDKPVVMRLPKDSLREVPNKVPAIPETYDVNPFEMAQLVGREGNIWFGDTRGLHRFFYTPLIRQELPKETSGSTDFSVVADDNGAVWINFGSGDHVITNLYHVRAGKAERRLSQVTTGFVYRAPDKTFWFSGEGCLWHLVGDDFVRVDLPPGMANQSEFLQTITGDRQGGIWVSFGRHGLYRLANGIWTPYGGRDGLPKTEGVIVAFTDSLGRAWFGYAKSKMAVLDGDQVRVFGPGDGLQVGNITAIYGRGPAIWIGGEFGLEQFDQGRFHNIAALNDEWLRGITGIVETHEGDLWLNAISGIFHIRKAEISEALKDSAYRVKGEHFGRREGLPGIASQLRPLPTAIEGTDGRLWFILHNGVVWLDPAAYSEKRTVPAPITIQSVSADDKFYVPDPGLSLPAHTSSVQISYTGVSLTDPEAIRFRYKLQETDKDWHEAAASVPITYRNLPPGSYHFSVEASDTNGVWSGAPANVAFTILPAFYQTNWFRLLCVAAFLALLWGLYQLRVQQLRGEERKLREAIETIPAMAWIAGPDGTVQFMNQRWVEYTGLSQLGTVREVGKDAIHPEDLDRSARRMGASFASGEPFEDEVRVRRADGEYRWFLNRGVPLRDKRGKVMKWYGAATDIQDRKRAEEALRESEMSIRLIVDGIAGLVAIMTPDGQVEFVNNQTVEYLGRPLEQVKDWATSDAVHPDDLPRAIAAWRHSVETGNTFEIDQRLRGADGAYRWFHIRGLPLLDAEGRIIRWYNLFTDIDERKRAEAKLQDENIALREEIAKASMFEEIVGTSSPLQTVLSRISKVAPSDSSVLITGETGTGKELVARAIHRRSRRSSHAFVSVNCAAIPRDLIASELFGHEKGAFTGATQRRIGRFELADGGTIFLDEVGELLPDTQAALLRVLQEREFERLGGNQTIHVDVRVVTATNRNLEAAVSNGCFRQDLLYRLNVFPIEVPPLRDRKDDILMLLEYFVQRYASRAGKNIRSIDKTTVNLLHNYDWPGNIRELQNVIERSVILCSSEVFSIDESWLSKGSSRTASRVQTAAPSKVEAEDSSEREIIEAALAESKGRVSGPSGAAARLGIPPSTLDHRIKALKIDKTMFKFR